MKKGAGEDALVTGIVRVVVVSLFLLPGRLCLKTTTADDDWIVSGDEKKQTLE